MSSIEKLLDSINKRIVYSDDKFIVYKGGYVSIKDFPPINADLDNIKSLGLPEKLIQMVENIYDSKEAFVSMSLLDLYYIKTLLLDICA